MTQINDRKVAIVGCGFVGAASAFALMQSGMFSEMVLIDADQDKAEGEALVVVDYTPSYASVLEPKTEELIETLLEKNDQHRKANGNGGIRLGTSCRRNPQGEKTGVSPF